MISVEYIGRSDTSLNRRLKEHIQSGEPYPHFMYSIANSVPDAYRKECANYHAYLDSGYRLNNARHPDRPDGHPSLVCPVCCQ
jgi:hypothetical protein